MGAHHLNLGRALRLSAMKYPDHVAIVYEGTGHTFKALNRQTNAFSLWLTERGVGAGDRVLILSRNSPDYVRVLFACAKVGAVTIPTNVMLRDEDIARLLDAASPALVLASEEFEDVARSALRLATHNAQLARLGVDTHAEAGAQPPTDGVGPESAEEPSRRTPGSDDDPASIIFTSGSSGTPKGVVKTHTNLMWHAINRQLSQPRHPGDVELFALPLTGVAFANFLLTDVVVGATCLLEPAFDPARVAAALSTSGVTHAFLAPTMLAAIEAVRPDVKFPSVRVLETAYEMPRGHRERVVRQFPNAAVLYSYGQTEGSMARSPAERFLTDLTCVGYASGLDEYRVDPDQADEQGVGEVLVAGPTVMAGYLGEAAPDVVRDGWLHSGDLGWQDDDGAIHFVGRIKDVIKSGGTSVHAADVEAALLDHPDVRAVAVIGASDEWWGEAVTAVIEPARGDVDVDSIRDHAGRVLAPFQRPKRYLVVDALPLNPTGKLAKGEVRRQVEQGELREVWRADR